MALNYDSYIESKKVSSKITDLEDKND